jgi:hypothetical protein
MDEFQRFRDLLHGESDAATLAREIFDYAAPRPRHYAAHCALTQPIPERHGHVCFQRYPGPVMLNMRITVPDPLRSFRDGALCSAVSVVADCRAR